jgi:hypothetical protein
MGLFSKNEHAQLARFYGELWAHRFAFHLAHLPLYGLRCTGYVIRGLRRIAFG